MMCQIPVPWHLVIKVNKKGLYTLLCKKIGENFFLSCLLCNFATVLTANGTLMERQTLSIGTFLKGNEYEVIRILGQGGFGITYECRQRGLNRSVAVKEFFMKDTQYRNDDGSISSATESQRSIASQHLAKFKKEAQTIAQMGDAQHVVKVFDIFDENNTTYYVMELIDGCNLADYVKAHGPMSELRAFCLGLQVAQALRFLHEHHTMHLDVKPANVLLRKQTSEDDNAVLIDFGLAKHYDNKGDETTATPVGISPGFAPMEQYSDGGVSHFTPTIDIYSLGATLYFLCTGRRPADAGTRVSQPMQKPAAMSNEAWQIISKAMEKTPQNRYANMQEMIRALEHVCQYLNETTETKPKKKQPASRKKHAWLLIALVALLAGIVALLCLSRCKGETKAVVEEDEEVKVHYQKKSDGAVGFVNGEGEIQERLGSWSYARNFHDGLAYVAEKINGVDHPYYIDRYGQKQITLEPGMYGWDFKDGRAVVRRETEKGIIDTTGRYVSLCQWKDITYCEQDSVFVVANSNGKKGIIDLDGNLLVQCNYGDITNVHEQLAVFKKVGFIQYGFMTLDGNEVIPDTLYGARSFSEGLAAVWDSVYVNDSVKVKKCGYIDKYGQVVIPFVWDEGFFFVNGRAIVRDGNKYKIIDRDNRVLNEVRGLDRDNKEYFWCDLQEGRAKVYSKASGSSLIGIIDYEGRLLADMKYKNIGGKYNQGLIWATDTTNKWGYLDVNGNVAIDFVYDGAEDFDDDGQAWVCKDGLWKLISVDD